MYGIFTQGIDGMHWIASERTYEDAVIVANETEVTNTDFVLIMKIEGIRDVDGEGENARVK